MAWWYLLDSVFDTTVVGTTENLVSSQNFSGKLLVVFRFGVLVCLVWFGLLVMLFFLLAKTTNDVAVRMIVRRARFLMSCDVRC